MEIEPPVRDVQTTHRCACVLVYPRETQQNACFAMIANPDSPMCDTCIQSGHEDLPRVPYGQVVAERARGERP